jgi:hypothetical protein
LFLLSPAAGLSTWAWETAVPEDMTVRGPDRSLEAQGDLCPNASSVEVAGLAWKPGPLAGGLTVPLGGFSAVGCAGGDLRDDFLSLTNLVSIDAPALVGSGAEESTTAATLLTGHPATTSVYAALISA